MDGSTSGPLLSWGNLRTRVVQAGGWVLAGFVLDKLIATAQLMVLTRLLLPSDFGLMATSAVIIVTATTLTEFGLEQSLIARRKITQDDLMTAWVIAISRGVVLGSILFVCAGPIAKIFHAPSLEWILRVHCLGLVIQSAQSPALTVLLKNLDLKRRVKLDLFRRVCEAAATLGIAIWLHSAWALVIGQLAGFAIGSLASYSVAPFRPLWSWDWKRVGQFIEYGKYINLTSVLIMGVMSGGELVISLLLGVESLGLYQIAMAIPVLIGIRLPMMMNQVAMPAYAFLEQSRQVAGRMFSMQVGLVAILLVPITAIVMIWAPAIIQIIAGEEWMEAAEPLRILAVFMACYALSSVMGALYVGICHPEYQARCWVVQFLVYASTIVPFTMHAGLQGAAGALSLSFVIGLAMHLRYARTALGEKMPSFLETLRQEYPRMVESIRGR
jgi:polysaccharide transporter, PST family